jgi:hypothetical protein
MAAFLAKGGKIQTVAEGVRSSSEGDLYAASRGEGIHRESSNDREERVLRGMGDTNWMDDSQFLAAKERAMIEG